MKKFSLLASLLLYISLAYPAADSWVQRCIGGKDLTIYIDAAINHVIKSSTTNARSGLHWQHLTAQDQTIAVKKNLQIGQITFKFNQYLVTTDSKTGLEIHHLALANLDDNHDCIIIDRSTNSAWVKSFFGSKLTNATDVRIFINQLLSSGDIQLDSFDDQESTITIQYQGQQYRAVLRYKATHNQQNTVQATLVTIYPLISCLGNIDRDNVPKNITEQLTNSVLKSATSSPVSGKSTPTSRSANSSPKTPETAIGSQASTPEKELRDIFMSAAGKPDKQGNSRVNVAALMDLCQQDPDLVSSTDKDGNTALHYLARTADQKNALDAAWLFMDQDVVNQLDGQEQTALVIALKNKNYELAQQILFAGGISQALQAAKYAVQTQNIDALKILIDHIDIYAPIKQFTMLGYAVSINSEPLITLLLKHGADPRALRYKTNTSSAGIESCENSEPAEFVHKFPHSKQDKDKLVTLLTDSQPVTKTDKLARWWQYLHEGKYISAARLYDPSWSNQRSPVTNKTVVEFACKREVLPLVQQLLADGADTLVQTTHGQSLHEFVKTLVSYNTTEKMLAIEQAVTQAFQQQVAAIDACVEKIQSQQIPDITKFTSTQLQYISPRYHCSIAQALSIAHNHSVVQTVLTQHKVALAPVLSYCLEHTTDWQHPASQQILATLTTQAKETQDKASFDALTNFCMRQTDAHQISAIVRSIAAAGANALELKLVEHFVVTNPVIAQTLIAQLSDRGLKLSREKRCAGNKMTLAELIVDKNSNELVTVLLQKDSELNIDILLIAAANKPEITAILQERKNSRALQALIDQAGHTPLTLAIVRGESRENIKEILANSPELLNQPSSKANIHPRMYAAKYAPSLLVQELIDAEIPENAIAQAFALNCSTAVMVELLAEGDCSLPLDVSTARLLMTLATHDAKVHSAVAQKVADYIELHTTLDKMPDDYFPVIQSFWEQTSYIPAATKFTGAQLARMKSNEQKVSYLVSLAPAGMIETVSKIGDTELIAQLIVRVIASASDRETIEKLFDLLQVSDLFTLTIKNQSLLTVASPFLDNYLPKRLKLLTNQEVVDQLTPLASKDSFISQIASMEIELVYTICEQLQDPVLTAKIIAKRLASNIACTILNTLITEEVALVELEKDGSTLAHVLMNHDDLHVLLHYCMKLPEFLFKPSKKKLAPVEVAIKKNKESVINTIVQHCDFNIHDLFDNFADNRNLYTLGKENRIFNTCVKRLIEQEFSQSKYVLQRAAELSPALIPDAVAYMERQGLTPKLQDYMVLHEAKQFEKFDELLQKHVEAGLPATILIPLAKRVHLRDKKYMQQIYHQMMIELSTSTAMNAQVFDMQKAAPKVVETFPFCLAELDEQTLMRELVANVKYDAPGKLLAEFINALEVVATIQTLINQDKSVLDKTDSVVQAIYNECHSYLTENGIAPSEETFVTQLRKIATNESIRFKLNLVTISNRLVMINCSQTMFVGKSSIVASMDNEQISKYWDDQLLEWTPGETHQATIMSFNSLSMVLFGLAQEQFRTDLAQLLALRIDTSERIRTVTTFATVYNTCKYIHEHPQAMLQDDQDLEKRFVHFCLQVIRNSLLPTQLDAKTAQRLCDCSLLLIDLCPSYGEYILTQVAPSFEYYLPQVKRCNATIKQAARHFELMFWAIEQHHLPVSKFLLAVSPIVGSHITLFDLDQPWAQSIKPEIKEQLQSRERVIKSNLFTWANLVDCAMGDVLLEEQVAIEQKDFVTKLLQFRDQRDKSVRRAFGMESLFVENIEDTATQEHLKIGALLSQRAPVSTTNLINGIHTIYNQTLQAANTLKIRHQIEWQDFFIHRNTVPLLFIYITKTFLFNANNMSSIERELAASTSNLFEQYRCNTQGSNLSLLQADHIAQYYLALALDLEICRTLVENRIALDVHNTSNLNPIINFCRVLQQKILPLTKPYNFEQYKTEMSAITYEIMENIESHDLVTIYFSSIVSML